MGRLLAALAHPNAPVRAAAAASVSLALWLVAWTVSYHWLPDGALSLNLALAAAAPIDPDRGASGLAATIFSWNLLLGVGVVVLCSLFAVGRLSFGYLAPWWWSIAYGVALGTNSFVIAGGERLAPNPEVLFTHVGLRELLAYVLVAAALANAHQWRHVRWSDVRLARVRHWGELRLRRSEAACLATAVALLAWTASVEGAQIARLLSASS